MNKSEKTYFLSKLVQINLFVSLLCVSIFTSCTPFKMEQYKECTKDGDCLASFERCDLYNFCVNEGSLCYWQLSDGSQSYQHKPQAGENIVGLLADHEQVSQSGQAWPAIVGLQTGLAMTQVEPESTSSILVCDPNISSRETVLETFNQYGVKTIIGEALENQDLSEDQLYISLGLNKIGTQVGQLYSNLLLGSAEPKIDQAFEFLSSLLLNSLSANQEGFISMLALQMNDRKYSEDFIERTIWRLSPYQESVFRTLIVSFESLFVIDEVIIDFLNNVSPLQYFVTLDPLSPAQLAELIETAQRKTTTSSTSMPLKILAYRWRISQSSIEQLTFWPKLIQYTVVSGQYPHFYHEPSHENFNLWKTMYDQARNQALSIDPNIVLPAPFFGLAYDAGVLAGLIHILSTSERSPSKTLSLLINTTSPTQELFLDANNIQLTFNAEMSDEQINRLQLQGLSGGIGSLSLDDNLAPLMLCSQNGSNIKAVPFVPMTEPEVIGEVMKENELGESSTVIPVVNYFEMPAEQLNVCVF